MKAAATARVLAALGHEGRLRIFRLLVRAGPQGLAAGEIGRQAGQLQNTASSNLSVLLNVGLASTRREGRSIIYTVAPTRFSEALEFLTEDFFEDRAGVRTAFFQQLLDTCSAGGPDEDREARSDRGDDAA